MNKFIIAKRVREALKDLSLHQVKGPANTKKKEEEEEEEQAMIFGNSKGNLTM